jgi:hypothetical protein
MDILKTAAKGKQLKGGRYKECPLSCSNPEAILIMREKNEK